MENNLEEHAKTKHEEVAYTKWTGRPNPSLHIPNQNNLRQSKTNTAENPEQIVDSHNPKIRASTKHIVANLKAYTRDQAKISWPSPNTCFCA